MSRLFVVVLALLASGCGSIILGPVPEKRAAEIQNLGVVSLLTDTFQHTYVGTTIFNNKENEAPVPEWKLDELATRVAVTEASNGGRFKVAPLAIAPRTAQDFYPDKSNLIKVDLEAILDLARNQGFDTLAIVRRTASENSPYIRGGYGLNRRAFLGLGAHCVYLMAVVSVHDVASGKRLGWQWAEDCTNDSEIPWKDDFAEYTDDERQVMRQKLEKLLADEVGTAVQKVRLSP